MTRYKAKANRQILVQLEKKKKKEGLIHMIKHSQSCFTCVVGFDIKYRLSDKHGTVKCTLLAF